MLALRDFIRWLLGILRRVCCIYLDSLELLLGPLLNVLLMKLFSLGVILLKKVLLVSEDELSLLMVVPRIGSFGAILVRVVFRVLRQSPVLLDELPLELMLRLVVLRPVLA